MFQKIFFVLGLSSLLMISFAQQSKPSKVLLSASSPQGNYIYLLDGRDLQDSSLLSSTDHFIIKRAIVKNSLDTANLSLLENSLKEIGVAKKPATSKELKNALPASGIKAMKEAFGLKSDEDLVSYLSKHQDPKQYFLFYQLIETRIALAHVFLDKDVSEGQVYLYQVVRVDKNNQQHAWGKTVVLGKAGNYKMTYFNTISFPAEVRDSSIQYKWAVPININLSTIPKPEKRVSIDPKGVLYNTFFFPTSLRASLEVGINDKWEKQAGALFPQVNKSKDTLFFTYSKRFAPGSVVRAFIALEDEVHNVGNKSDTINAFLITKKNAPAINFLSVTDTLNGLFLHWNPLPESPFISGVQIIKYGVGNIADTLPLLPIGDTTYFDAAIKAGITYRYEVRALYLPGMAVYQTLPANSFGTLTKFSKPNPPFNLTATNEGSNIRLQWNTTNDPTIDAYFVYRGTTPQQLSLFSGRITSTNFLDTTPELSGGSQYYYAVISQNLKQDTSIFSNVVSIIPQRKIEIPAPTEVTFYYTNGALNIFWQDSRRVNNMVKSFIVQKKLKNETDFTTITQQPIEAITLKDTAIKMGTSYHYRVAAISIKGDTSNFSEAFEYSLAKGRVDVLNKFDLLNGPKGITVSLPTVYYDNRKAYNIFRRKASEPNFSRIARISANEFVYLDTKVIDGESYFYAISITETDDREGKMGMPASINR